MINILIADDQELMRQSLKIMLSSQPNFAVTDTVSNGREVLESIKKNKPDIILMDIRMPEMDGVVCTQKVKEIAPDIKVIILTTFDDDEFVFNAIKFGASGYLLKGTSLKDLTSAITKVYNGKSIMNDEITGKVFRMFSQMAQTNQTIRVGEQLTGKLRESEWKIIDCVGRGMSNKEIAQRLHLSEGTIRNSLSVILSKLGLKNRTQLGIWAVQTDTAARMYDSDDE
ncbi:MAG: response regulator transcription factor [Lachnospiraceae bacterium]|jgi:DNA-binding NarL/FixJ family response regulator|nr:response regulator transcription factor [Lachnospiraceae bacterium]MBR3339578.1 response regulator transcription factor [Lachnospiraceae bacterium]